MSRRFYDNRPQDAPPRFMPGDPIIAVDDGTPGKVDFARRDGMVNVTWETGTREWVHESEIGWGPGFEPMRRC